MLAAARAKPGAANDVTWARASLAGRCRSRRRSTSAPRFYDTLNHLPDAAALARAFAAAAAVLRPGGLLVFDVTSRHGFEEWWESEQPFQRRGLVDAASTPASTPAREIATARRDAGARRRHPPVRRSMSATSDPRRSAAALAAAGFAVEQEEAWSPFPIGGLGKTWWTARRR